MKNIDSSTKLRAAILALEVKHAEEGQMLKEQFKFAFESIKPINLIKSTFKEAAESQDLKHDILNTSVGLTAGYLLKISLESVSNTPLKKLFTSVVLFGITSVTKNPEAALSMGKGLLRIIRSKREAKINGAANHETIF
ncbi:MAG: hypothetical protein SH857_09965 [Chitinophagales bacterium]|nr:hypothetical protein [Chitinophagales bacterium]